MKYILSINLFCFSSHLIKEKSVQFNEKYYLHKLHTTTDIICIFSKVTYDDETTHTYSYIVHLTLFKWGKIEEIK